MEQFPDSLEQRIDDAIQRPWAQVIQFGLELHPAPEPIIYAMLARPADGFCTGLRLVGRCIANGARVSESLRNDVGDRLVAFWISAPNRARERVGRLLADGFSNPPTQALRDVLHYHWLIDSGAGDIISKLNESDLTQQVLADLLEKGESTFMVWHSLKPALCAAGDSALRVVINALNPETRDAETLANISSVFSNFTPTSVSRDLVLSVAHDDRLPMQARMSAYNLAGCPLEADGVAMTIAGLRHPEWENYYKAASLVDLHVDPARFVSKLIRDATISVERRRDLVTRLWNITAEPEQFFNENIVDLALDIEISITLRLYAARSGNRQIFQGLVEEVNTLPIEHAATTIALFGHFPEKNLAERAADTKAL